jgi:integrase
MLQNKKTATISGGFKQERVTVNVLFDGLERDYKLRDKWGIKVSSNVKPVREHFGTWRAADLTEDAIGKYIEGLREEGYSNATVNRRTQLLGQAFKVAIRNKQLSQSPFIPRVSEVGNERQGFFGTAEFEAVVAKLPEYLRDFTRFGFFTGWRKGSIESLRWSDVGEDLIYLRAKNSKTRKSETMPLEGELLSIIERRRAARVIEEENGGKRLSEFVFHRQSEPIGDFRKAWATACCAAGIGKMICPQCEGDVDKERQCANCEATWKHEQLKYVGRIFHDFRRTASRNMLTAGVPQAVAMKITGHRTDSMFRRYAIVDEEQKREALARTQKYIATSSQRKVVEIGGK